MIDDEMYCNPNPQWSEDFKKEIMKDCFVTRIAAIFITGKVQRIVRNQQREWLDKACKWLKVYDITFTETPSMLEDFRKAMKKEE